MLIELSISNIAIIESLQISFNSGLTALTGETGAGKSIIIDAVSLIMGERASTDIIRSGADEAFVEGLFDVSTIPTLQHYLKESGFDGEHDLIIKRTISRSGKNRVFINGCMATLTVLSNIAQRLINIYGQHESQTLLRPENQLNLLDAYAGCRELREGYTKLHADYSTLVEKIQTLDQEERELARKLDLLLFQSQEIGVANLQKNEEEKLEEQCSIASSAEKRYTLTNEAFDLLYSGDNALLGKLRRIIVGIRNVATIDEALAPLKVSLDETYLQLEDAAISLRDYASRIESDPSLLQTLEDRLDLISRLKRKYGSSIEEILIFKERVDKELQQIQGSEQYRHDLDCERIQLSERLSKAGEKLSLKRHTAAIALQEALVSEAQQLAMKDAIITINLDKYPEPRATGCERVEILFSPNPGEQPRPLARIASGGELSRLMLAFKQVLPESDVPTLIFDEVDTGISGATSELVGKKLKNVSRHQQVFCITHLPQVASCADHHLLVKKNVLNKRTTTSITPLENRDRIHEIARLLAGEKITQSALTHAQEMLGIL